LLTLAQTEKEAEDEIITECAALQGLTSMKQIPAGKGMTSAQQQQITPSTSQVCRDLAGK